MIPVQLAELVITQPWLPQVSATPPTPNPSTTSEQQRCRVCMISLLQMSSQAMALGWFAMMVGAARSTCVGPVPYLEEANVFRDQGRGGTWFRLNPQVPQAPTALSACGGGSSIVAEVFAGPTCDNLVLHATLVLQCERWSLVALTTGVPGYLRVLGAGHGDRVVLRQKVLAAPTCTGAAAAEGAEAAKAPSIADRTEADDARPRFPHPAFQRSQKNAM